MKKLDKCLNLAEHVTGLEENQGGGRGSRGKYNKKSVFKRIKLFSLFEEKDDSDNLF